MFSAVDLVFESSADLAALGLRFHRSVALALDNVLVASSAAQVDADADLYCDIVEDVQGYVKRLLKIQVFPHIVGEVQEITDSANIVARAMRGSAGEGKLYTAPYNICILFLIDDFNAVVAITCQCRSIYAKNRFHIFKGTPESKFCRLESSIHIVQ